MSRNPGTSFDPEWIRETHCDGAPIADAARDYADTSTGASGEPPEVDLLKTAVRCLDHTNLRARRPNRGVSLLCQEARAPLAGICSAPEDRRLTVASVCVFPEVVSTAFEALLGSPIPVAAACGFPAGTASADRTDGEVRQALAAGAREIDAVADRRLIMHERWEDLYGRVRRLRATSSGCLLKVIVRSGTLPTESLVARASLVCAMAGADFIKTSTGMDRVNATLEAGVAIAAAIRAYRDRTGFAVGLKPAGGLRAAADAMAWLRLARGELGSEWVDPALFRLGASSLLAALRQRLSVLEAP